MNIFLIGYRCTGKTTAGRLLAEKKAWPFIDADAELVKKYKISISQMVSEHGWDYFRQKERMILQQFSSLDNHVISTGGGAVLNSDNIKDMKKNGMVVWLKAVPETIKNRIIKDQNTKGQRPALTNKGLIEEIEETLEFRNPLYESAADISIDTDTISIEIICNTILKNLKRV